MNLLEILHQYAEQEPTDPFNWYALATEYRKHNLLTALKYYEKVWKEFPHYAPNYYHLAEVYALLQETQKAQQVYEEGLQILKQQNETKLLQELQNAYQNFLIENNLL